MLNIFSSLILDAQTGAPSSGMNNPVFMIVVMLGFVAFFYFMVVRPQNKKKKDMELMLKAMKKGDKVVSIGGVHGKIVNVKENEVVVKVDSNAEITFDKSAIAKILGMGAESSPAKKPSEKKKSSKKVNETKLTDAKKSN